MRNSAWGALLASLSFAVLAVFAFEIATYYAAASPIGSRQEMGAIAFSANTLLVYAAINGLFAVTGRWLVSLVFATGIGVLVWIINATKLSLLGRPVLPWDIFLVDEMLLLAPSLWSGLKGVALLLLATPLVFGGILYSVRNVRIFNPSASHRFAAGVLAVAILAAISGFGWLYRTPSDNAKRPFLQAVIFDQKLSYQKNGFLLSSALNLFAMAQLSVPPDYSKHAVETLLAKRDRGDVEFDATSNSVNAVNPVNVILILAEAFWDPTQLGVEFSSDPIPFFRQVEDTYPGRASVGTLTVPTFGGMTVLTEFEILTGLPISLFPSVANPYSMFIRRPIPALPEMFRASGYRTTAIHPYYGAFWERSKVFPLLGFERFLDIDDFEDPIYQTSHHVSDESLVDKIIEVSQASADTPHFIYGISISTHGPFTYHAFDDAPLGVVSPISQQSSTVLKTYINALSLADRAFARLLAHFATDPRDTLIVLFGDHLPLLGRNFGVYREVHYVADEADYHRGKMRSPPLLVWANFPIPDQPRKLASFSLLSRIAKLARLPENGVIEFNRYAHEILRGDGLTAGLENEYRLLSYDLLFGEQFAITPWLKPGARVESESRNRFEAALLAGRKQPRRGPVIGAWGPPRAVAGQLFNAQPDGASAFWFKADHVTPHTEVWLEDVPLPTVFSRAGDGVTSRVEMDLIRKPGNYRIRLRDRRSGESGPEVIFVVVEADAEAESGSRSMASVAALASERPPSMNVAHAGGRVEGRAYSNSRNALELSYAKGFRLFELDISWTSDGELVLIHDWEHSVTRRFGVEPRQYSLEEFGTLESVANLSQMSVADLASWVELYPDVKVVTDIKHDNLAALARIAKRHPRLRDRSVVQIYRFEEYSKVAELGYPEILLTLYRSRYTDDEIVGFARLNSLAAVTMPVYRAKTKLPKRLAELGVYVYAHTVNDLPQACELASNGVDGFYTDDLDPKPTLSRLCRDEPSP